MKEGPLNIRHGLHPRRDLNRPTLDAFVDMLDAWRASFVRRERASYGGLEKFEPREVEALPLGLRG